MRYIVSFVLMLPFISISVNGQQTYWDSLNIRYKLLQNNYHQSENIIKIKIPPYLSTSEVMEQIKLAVCWPGDPEPDKKTLVYVFKDNAVEGETSVTGGVFRPGKGFKWELQGWIPETTVLTYTPSYKDKLIYNTLLDSVFSKGTIPREFENEFKSTKKDIAKDFNLSVAGLDSIYYLVKWWRELNGD